MTGWQGKTPHVVHWKFYTICGLTFWLILPLYFMWRRFRTVQYTAYYLDSSGAGKNNSVNPGHNRFFEKSRIDRIDYVQKSSLNHLFDVYIYSTHPQIPPIVFPSVKIPVEIIKSYQDLIAEAKEKNKIKNIAIPVLQ